MQLRAVPALTRDGEPDDRNLIERTPEMEALERALRSVEAGVGAAVAIEGPAGIGKTALVTYASRNASDAGWLVRCATPVRVEAGLRFGVLRALLEPPLRRVAAPQRERLLEGTSRLAGDFLMGRVSPDEMDAITLAQSVLSLCDRLGEQAPLALMIDDAQWSDEASLDVLAHLARHIKDVSMMLVVAARTGCRDRLPDIGTADSVVRLRPAPLTWAGAMRLIRRLAPGTPLPACAQCCGSAMGNPWLIERLASALPDCLADSSRAEVPLAVRDAVRRRLRDLTPGERSLAVAQSILGDEARPRALACLAGTTMDDLVALRGGLAAAGLFDPTGKGFVHDLISAAVEADLDPPERDRLHRDGAFASATSGSDAEQAASHLMRSEPRGDATAVDLLSRAAAGAAAGGRPGRAVDFLQRALAEGAPTSDRPQLLIELAHASFDAGIPGIRESLDHALGEATDEATRSAAATALRGHALIYGGAAHSEALPADAPAEARAADRAWSGVARGAFPAAEAAELALETMRSGLLLSLAWEHPGYHQCIGVLVICERFADARLTIERLRREAVRRGSIPMQIAAAWYEAEVDLRAGALAAAEAKARDALALAEGDTGAFSAGAVRVLVWSLAERGAFEEAHELLRARGFEAEAAGSPGATGVLEARALLALTARDYAGAETDAREVGLRAAAEGRVNPGWGSWSSIEALALAYQGELKGAAAVAETELDRARAFGAPGRIARAYLARAVAEGDNLARAAMCERALAEIPGAPRLELARLRVELGAAMSRLGHRIEARSALRPALADADAAGASVLAQRARRELVATGLRPRRAALDGVGALTPRQQEICELAAAGKGNRAIAQQLFLSIKTVETHLAAVYCKLGVTGRAQLAAALGG